MKINVYSEIGKLQTVLLHRPGKELENLTPDLLERLLFDDIPYLKVAQEEHAHIEVEGESGAGLVKATVNGKKQVLKIVIDDSMVNTSKMLNIYCFLFLVLFYWK